MSPTLAPPPKAAKPVSRSAKSQPVAPTRLKPPGVVDGSVTVPASAHTLDGFRKWVRGGGVPDGVKAAYWDGEVWLEMTNERLKSHSAPKSRVVGAMQKWFDDAGVGRALTDGPLLVNDSADLSNGPDAVAVLWSSFDEGRVSLGTPTADGRDSVELIGSPDLVVEVVSPPSVDKDTQVLAAKYFQAGIPEYWIVDALTDPPTLRVLVRGEEGYVEAAAGEDGWQRSGVLGRDVRMVVREQPHGFVDTLFEDRGA